MIFVLIHDLVCMDVTDAGEWMGTGLVNLDNYLCCTSILNHHTVER